MSGFLANIICLLSGIVIGALIHKLRFTLNHEKEIQDLKNTHERANQELQYELSCQLGKMRNSIIQVADLYSKTVDILKAKLPDKNNPSIYLDLEVEKSTKSSEAKPLIEESKII